MNCLVSKYAIKNKETSKTNIASEVITLENQ